MWDIADDKYFMKANDSDAQQWNMLYPKIGAHSTSCAPLTASRDTTAPELIADYVLIYPLTVLLITVWAIFWIVFEAAVITGFVLLGIACFRLSKEQMYAQAGVCARF